MVLFVPESTKKNQFQVSVPYGTGFIDTKNLLIKTCTKSGETTGRLCDKLGSTFEGYDLKGYQ